MRTQEVVYVPIPEDSEEEKTDRMVQCSYKMLLAQGFRLGGVARIRFINDVPGLGMVEMRVRCFMRNY